MSLEELDTPIKKQGQAFDFGILYAQLSFPLRQLQSGQWHPVNTTAPYERGHGTVHATQLIVYFW